MVAAPDYFQATFLGMSGRIYNKDGYFSDVASAAAKWDSGQGASATSAEQWIPPENVVLKDIAIVVGGTDTLKFQLTRNGVSTGDILRHSVHLNTLANRPVLSIPFGAGQQIGAIQLA